MEDEEENPREEVEAAAKGPLDSLRPLLRLFSILVQPLQRVQARRSLRSKGDPPPVPPLPGLPGSRQHAHLDHVPHSAGQGIHHIARLQGNSMLALCDCCQTPDAAV